MTTLVVDDDPTVRRYLKSILDGEVRVAASLEEGAIAAEDWQPAVIVLDNFFRDDYGRPRLTTGIDAIRYFKTKSPRSEIILLTGRYEERLWLRAHEQGALAMVGKDDLSVMRAYVIEARANVKTSFVRPAKQAVH